MRLPGVPTTQPPLTSVPRFLLWQVGQQKLPLTLGVFFGTLWTICQVVWPYLLGRAIDEGVTGNPQAVVGWCLALLAVALLQALSTTFRHRMAITNWLRSSLNVARLVGYHTARVGRAITAETPAGEILSSVTNDALRFGGMFDITARLSGSIISYVVVGAILLQQSLTLGLLAIFGVPFLGLALAIFIPPLQRRQWAWRREMGRLNTLGADTVAGLRVLRGIGGEDVFVERYAEQSQAARRAGINVARIASWIDGLNVLLPGLLVAAFLWTGAQFVVVGDLSAGEFVTLTGYSVFLLLPLHTVIESVQAFTNGAIATKRIISVLSIEPSVGDAEEQLPPPPPGVELLDVASGVVIPSGRFIGLVDPNPDAAAAVALRLGRFDDASHRNAPVLWGGIDHTKVPIQEVRRRIVVSDAMPHLFTGRLLDGLDIRVLRRYANTSEERQRRVEAALAAVAAMETVEALPEGLQSTVSERARTFSGGQRQRLSLARALLTDAEVLVLIEPTSAVDAHTEAMVADGIRQLRSGRTTVVVTESPLVLDRADIVHVLDQGIFVGSGTHSELLHRSDSVGALYRSIVARGAAPVPVGASGGRTIDPPFGADALAPVTIAEARRRTNSRRKSGGAGRGEGFDAPASS